VKKANLPGYNPTKIYECYRRYSDFDWLHAQLQHEENLAGFALPALPEKKILWKNSKEFVEKRRQELELYLTMLIQHPNLRKSKNLHAFLTIEKTEEFENYKDKPIKSNNVNSLVMDELKNLQLKNTFNLAYSLLKSKLFSKEEPADVQSMYRFEEIISKIDKRLPLLEKIAKSIEREIEFKIKFIEDSESLLKTTSENELLEYENLERLITNFYNAHSKTISVFYY